MKVLIIAPPPPPSPPPTSPSAAAANTMMMGWRRFRLSSPAAIQREKMAAYRCLIHGYDLLALSSSASAIINPTSAVDLMTITKLKLKNSDPEEDKYGCLQPMVDENPSSFICAVAKRRCEVVLAQFTECTFTDRSIVYPGRGLMAGWFDCCPGYAVTLDRRGGFDFTLPYTVSDASFAVAPGNPSGFDPDATDYSSFTLIYKMSLCFAGCASSSPDRCLHQRSVPPGLGKTFGNILVASNLPEAKALLLNGTAQVLFSPRNIIPDLEVLPERVVCSEGGTAMMVKKGSPLPAWWNPAFKSYSASGRFHQLCQEDSIKYNHSSNDNEAEVVCRRDCYHYGRYRGHDDLHDRMDPQEIVAHRCLQQGETTLSEGLHRARHCLKEAAGEITVIKLGRLLNYSDPGENQTKALYPLSTERETARRRVESTAREVFYFITAKMDALRSGYFSVNESTEPFIDSTKRELEDYKLALSSDLHRLRHVDKDEEWRDSESRRLGELVQRRLHDLQNPQNCSEAKLVVCNLGRPYGFGSMLHEATMCLLTAYATHRTLVLTTNGWRFTPSTWDTFMMPLSTCTANDTRDMDPKNQTASARVVQLQSLIGEWNHSPSNFRPRAIPADLARRLKTFHGDPPTWWVGQLVSFLLRPQPHLQPTIQTQGEKMGFQRPIVGLQVRRSDKVNVEAALHSLEEYMKHVEEYYDLRQQHEDIKERRLFLATDDPSVFTELNKKYPQYNISRVEGSATAASVNSRYTKDGLSAVLVDLHFLSMCDFVVCTFTSNICLAVYELLQTRHGDASMKMINDWLDRTSYHRRQRDHVCRLPYYNSLTYLWQDRLLQVFLQVATTAMLERKAFVALTLISIIIICVVIITNPSFRQPAFERKEGREGGKTTDLKRFDKSRVRGKEASVLNSPRLPDSSSHQKPAHVKVQDLATGIEKSQHPLSVERETARRRVESTAREVFYFITAKMDSLSHGHFAANQSTKQFINDTKTEMEEYKRYL
ncbi:hypothetical protein C0Q70_16201 [Pomacea canaliculata]|uniref:GT23 domain-containing protein n=1 Tax=Pomacea canaliculata TaxID=400727 RepID=A0A2T7NP45_POMCA|nr:hypothetical protein C0Q70_16201 [Pomacea canaliculata]